MLNVSVSQVSGEAVREETRPSFRLTRQIGEVDGTEDQPTRESSVRSASTVESSTSTGADNSSITTAETAFENNDFSVPSFDLNQGSVPASDDIIQSWKLGQAKE